MSRRKKRRVPRERREDKPWFDFELSEETKNGILVVVFFALGALLLLSFFSLAGSVGEFLDSAMAALFGWDRFFIPVIMVLIGATLLFPERGVLSGWNYLGFLFFFLSLNALTNVFAFRLKDSAANPSLDQLNGAGGYIGEFLGRLIPHFTGVIAAVIILAALFFVALMLSFNTSLRNLMALHTHLSGGFGAFLHRLSGRGSETEEEELLTDEDFKEDEEGEEEETDEDVETEEADEETTRKAFRHTAVKGAPSAPPEKALTTRLRRKPMLALDLLEYRGNKPKAGDIERNKEIIRKTYENFNISVEMGDVAVGPTVAQFTLRPAEGVKLSRIVALQNDLALALAAHPIRIEAPIPGRSLVGVEVPNQTVAIVALRELLESKPFVQRSSQLTIPLGKDVSGKCWVAPLDKMPHLLVAGATGSGKSVALNTIIIALVYQNGPDDVKFIMVDPKRVELTAYDGLPHLLVPPITKVDDTVNALKWTVREMERRLDVLSKFGARDINSYNAKAEDKMPRIIVVIDELADLMTASGHEVEAAIVRIAQMARAAGIHLVLATQRPSVDIITGTIKANFPARIAFAVASQTDSRTILDISGAEKLLGRGDMLYTCAELSKPKRIQGAYVSEAEVKRVVEHLKKEHVPDYNYVVTEKQKGGSVFSPSEDENDDPLLNEAAQVVIESGKASTSLLQRRLKIGYGRAARILDILEEKGVVGPSEGSRAREILVDEWPMGGDFEGIPTAESDLDEAGVSDDEEDEDEEELEETEEVEEDEDDEKDEEASAKGGSASGGNEAPAEDETDEKEQEEEPEEDEEEEDADADKADEVPAAAEADEDEDEFIELDPDKFEDSQEGEYLDEEEK